MVGEAAHAVVAAPRHPADLQHHLTIQNQVYLQLLLCTVVLLLTMQAANSESSHVFPHSIITALTS